MINHLTLDSFTIVVQGKPYKQTVSREDTLLIQHTRPRGGCPSKKGLDDLLTFQGRLSHRTIGWAWYSARNIMIKVLYHKPFPNISYKEQVHVTSIAIMEVTSESSELLYNRSSCQTSNYPNCVLYKHSSTKG